MKSISHIVVAALVANIASAHDGDHSNEHSAIHQTETDSGDFATFTTYDPDATTPTATIEQTGCPTVTETASICSNCPVPECLGLVNLVQSCGCPLPIATETITYGCDTACEDMGIKCAATTYIISTEDCDTALPTETASESDSEEGDETVSDLETMPTMIEEDTDTDTSAPETSTDGTTSSSTTLANDGEVTVNAAAGRFKAFRFW